MEGTLQKPDILPDPIVVSCRDRRIDELLTKEWLLTNGIGAYASSTVVGCNTRRYHGLLVAATVPPVGRIVALSSVMEQVVIAGRTYELAVHEFPGAFWPEGLANLREFRNDVAVTFVFQFQELELLKRIILADRENAVAVQYVLRAASGGTVSAESATLRLRAFAAMRGFHSLRGARRRQQMTFQTAATGAMIQDRDQPGHCLHVTSQEARFQAEPQWWRKFVYRADHSRGAEGLEDLYSPGVHTFQLRPGQSVQLNASLGEPVRAGFDTTMRRRHRRFQDLASGVGEGADETTRRLAVATDAFVVQRSFPGDARSATILAGYHWFADWGRDAFLSLPGLLLCTGDKRFDLARQVFSTFARHIWQGMIPNRFDDYSTAAHYNSIDASLWFIVAAERYLAATGDTTFWRDVLMPSADMILTAYQAGTMFDIRADADGLLTGGSPGTQLTWMDVKIGDEAITPRHGKAVEVNALWYNAHRIMAQRCRDTDKGMAVHYGHQADLIGPVFARTFWNPHRNCLYDCISGPNSSPDASIRPNQIFAVSLPHSPLSLQQQHGVLHVVTEKLLTPYGLRTLARDEPAYRGSCTGGQDQRDRAYHQGTVWPWLLGPYVEAYLKLNGDNADAVRWASGLLAAFDGHVHEAGLGYISEIFDGDGPHAPRGCIAQAWSVAEILRAKQLIARRWREISR